MNYREFTQELSESCSSFEFAQNITGYIMDAENCFDWQADIPENYVKIHLPYLFNAK